MGPVVFQGRKKAPYKMQAFAPVPWQGGFSNEAGLVMKDHIAVTMIHYCRCVNCVVKHLYAFLVLFQFSLANPLVTKSFSRPCL